MDPRRVVLCMPGAHLEQIESDRAFLGSVKVAVGPFTTSYKGRVEFTEVDESLHTARLTAEGQERGGGAAHGSMVSSLRTVEEGTEVVVDVSVEGASRIVHLGLGLTQNLAQELFGQFVTCVKERLEAPPGAASTGGTPPGTAPVQVVASSGESVPATLPREEIAEVRRTEPVRLTNGYRPPSGR